MQAEQQFNVVYQAGVAWRTQPSFNLRYTATPGPACGTMVSGTVYNGDVQYVVCNVGAMQLFCPIYTPQGVQLLAPSGMMQQQLNNDVYRVQQSFGNIEGGKHGKKSKNKAGKVKGHKLKKK
eukprot:TRINITY_DN3581_c0_g2_i2.p2 TRINITY_DN3581_c0_g2~~TRINITY_DN3581_c0_g2_i2.p2  ORF type:complete len:122 (+),score=29.83 TRINITY_DN3581_c0_g2_i2:201-566(+)